MDQNFFNFMLRQAEVRVAPTKGKVRYQLDKNEQTDDIDPELKQKVLESLMKADWNRYPTSDYQDIEKKIAEYCGLEADNIVLSAGSASIITTLLDFFALNHKKIIISQPSYSLFDYHCKTYNIPYEPWLLSQNLEYSLEHLPALGPDSVMIITSPNNPVGNTISPEMLTRLLTENPDSLFIVDGVYTEFSSFDFTPWVKQFSNLIVLRSFSKAFPIAGLRLGYLCAAAQTAAIIKKLILQFSITHFSLIFAREILFNPTFMHASKIKVRDIILERERVSNTIKRQFNSEDIQVFKSEGNFLLFRIFDGELHEKILQGLNQSGIKVLNTSNFPMLKHTLRVSIGNCEENDSFLQCLAAYLVPVIPISIKKLNNIIQEATA